MIVPHGPAAGGHRYMVRRHVHPGLKWLKERVRLADPIAPRRHRA